MRTMLSVMFVVLAVAAVEADDFPRGPFLGEVAPLPTPAPVPMPVPVEPAFVPVPRASYQTVPMPVESGATYNSGPTYSFPPAPGSSVQSYHAGSQPAGADIQVYDPMLQEGVYGPMLIMGTPQQFSPGVTVYPFVRVFDPHRVARDAVPTIIQVPDPCDPRCSCVSIEVCLPACRCPRVVVGPLGRRLIFDYGVRSVVITSRVNGMITVNYN